MFCFSFDEIYFRVHKDKFKGVHSFEDNLYTGISKYSPKLFTETRNIGNRDEDIFLDL